jgi:hypothetical protein
MMTSPETSLARRIHRVVNTALWFALALAVAGLMRSLPEMSASKAQAEREQLLEEARESHFYCEKWGMAPGTHEHTICTMDLQSIRAQHSARLVRDFPF